MKSRKLFILGCSLMTLTANQLTVLAQTRKPTSAEINQLRQELKETIRALHNSLNVDRSHDYFKDKRTQAEKNQRESFVRSWLKIEPKLAPFIGLWYGYEDARHIYPSKIKGRICIISTDEGYGKFNTGVFVNGVIQTNEGTILFREGNFLDSAALKNGIFVSNRRGIPFNHPKPLVPLAQLPNYIYESSSHEQNQIIQQFKRAGCTDSIPSIKSNSKLRQSIQNLANGNYFYGEVRLSNQSSKHYIAFQKKGINIIGLSYIYPGDYDCFKGIAKNNTITNLMFTQQEFGSGSGNITLERGAKPFNLTSYHRLRYDSSFNRKIQQCFMDFQKIQGVR